MSEQKQQNTDTDTPSDLTRLLTLVNAIVLVLTFLVSMISMVAVLALRSDVASLEDQVRRIAKSAKTLQEEITTMRESAEPPKAKPSLGATPAPRPVHIDAADPSQDCVIRPGDTKSLSNCIGAATPGR